jgi:hypothetical protein
MKKYVPDLLSDFEDSWLGIRANPKDKPLNQKFKDYISMKVLIKNLTRFSLYLKTKSNPNKVYLTQIFAKKLNRYLVERRQQFEGKCAGSDFFFHGLLIPFAINNNTDKSILVG